MDAVGRAAKCGSYGGGERKNFRLSGGSDGRLSMEHANKGWKLGSRQLRIVLGIVCRSEDFQPDPYPSRLGAETGRCCIGNSLSHASSELLFCRQDDLYVKYGHTRRPTSDQMYQLSERYHAFVRPRRRDDDVAPPLRIRVV